MATPKMTLDESCIPQNLVLSVDASGNVTPTTTGFIMDSGTIQFTSASTVALTATFFPPNVFGGASGVVNIPANSTPTPQLSPGEHNVTVNYMITGPNISTGPHAITVGCSPLTINFDAGGNIAPVQEQTRIPNGGSVIFAYSASATENLTISFTPDHAFGPSLTLTPGQSQTLHAKKPDLLVEIATVQPADGNGGTVKIGSGGSPQDQ
jgi:hypothetical protein